MRRAPRRRRRGGLCAAAGLHQPQDHRRRRVLGRRAGSRRRARRRDHAARRQARRVQEGRAARRPGRRVRALRQRRRRPLVRAADARQGRRRRRSATSSSSAAPLPRRPALRCRRIDVAAMPDGEQICGCNGVCKGTICRAIRDKGLATLDAVRAHTKASASCGSCTALVEAILAHVTGGAVVRSRRPADVQMHRCSATTRCAARSSNRS